MTADFTQGYPDWGRVLAANPDPFVNQPGTTTPDETTFGPFPIAAWPAVYLSWFGLTSDVQVKLSMSISTLLSDTFQEDFYWTTAATNRRIWVPLAGNFLFVQVLYQPPLVDTNLSLRVIPVSYMTHANRVPAEDFLLSNSVSVAAAATHTAESAAVFLGPMVFTWSTNATTWTNRLRWRNFSNVLRDFFFINNTHVGWAGSPWFLYVPDGRVRLEFTNSDAAARGLTYAAIPLKPALGNA